MWRPRLKNKSDADNHLNWCGDLVKRMACVGKKFSVIVWFRCALVCLCLMVLATGCFEVEQVIDLKKDGSAEIRLHYVIPADKVDAFKRFRGQVDLAQGKDFTTDVNQLTWFFSEYAARKFFAQSDARLVDYRAWQRDQYKHVRVICRTSNILSALQSGCFGEFSLSKDDEVYTLAMTTALQNLPNAEKTGADQKQRSFQKLKPLFEGMKVSLTLRVPGEIVETSAERRPGKNKILWKLGGERLLAWLENGESIFCKFTGQSIEIPGLDDAPKISNGTVEEPRQNTEN